MSIQTDAKVRELEERVATLERLERAHYDTIDKLLARVDVLERAYDRPTLTLPEKRKSA